MKLYKKTNAISVGFYGAGDVSDTRKIRATGDVFSTGGTYASEHRKI